ncbi:MAG: AAA family ATPase [Eubacteriales bacterium]
MIDELFKLDTVDAERLQDTPIAPLRYVVEDLIPQGLHILAGSPKIGKSWLMLYLCLQVSKGEPIWGYTTNKCDVLYLCLEDTYKRIQNRMFEITDDAPSNLYFSVTAALLADGLKEQIKDFISDHRKIGLIVIDTFQRIRGLSFNNNAYANDYFDTSQLKDIADDYGVALILVHHLRKDTSTDPLMMISGSTGISGGVDCNYILVKEKRYSDTARLIISGRDTEYQEITLKFEGCIWKFVSCDKTEDIIKREIPDFVFQLVSFMEDKEIWSGNATQLLSEMNDELTPVNTVTKLINQYHDTLFTDNDILYEYSRTSKGRIIQLQHVEKYDSNDSYDGELPAGE